LNFSFHDPWLGWPGAHTHTPSHAAAPAPFFCGFLFLYYGAVQQQAALPAKNLFMPSRAHVHLLLFLGRHCV
jgi:hypothetical protein